jgi:cytochrome P450
VSTTNRFPLGATVTLERLDLDPHSLLAQLREREPVSWLPALDGWLVTSHDLALEVMHDATRFTVDDPRFSTAQVIGPSMLSLDGDEHAHHRSPFVAPFRAGAVRERFADATEQEAERLIRNLEPAGSAELRRSFAGPLAASIVARALGFGPGETDFVLGWYDAIVTSVTAITGGQGATREGKLAYAELSARLQSVIDSPEDSLLGTAASSSALTHEQIASNAAVLLFGGIETTEGMIANAALHLLERSDQLALVLREPTLLDVAIEESLRLEPAAAMIDRYATADISLGGAPISRNDLVRVSIAAANRDPAVFTEPDRFDLSRANSRRHIAFARGPHVCVGVHLARLEARTALRLLLTRLLDLRLDPARPSPVRGLVFRKPPALNVVWRTD